MFFGKVFPQQRIRLSKKDAITFLGFTIRYSKDRLLIEWRMMKFRIIITIELFYINDKLMKQEARENENELLIFNDTKWSNSVCNCWELYYQLWSLLLCSCFISNQQQRLNKHKHAPIEFRDTHKNNQISRSPLMLAF